MEFIIGGLGKAVYFDVSCFCINHNSRIDTFNRHYIAGKVNIKFFVLAFPENSKSYFRAFLTLKPGEQSIVRELSPKKLAFIGKKDTVARLNACFFGWP